MAVDGSRGSGRGWIARTRGSPRRRRAPVAGAPSMARRRARPAGLGLLVLVVVAAARRRDRRGRLGLLGLTLTLTLTSLAWAPSAQAAYGFRKALTIDRTRIGTAGGATTLTNYPLPHRHDGRRPQECGRRPRSERERIRHRVHGRRHDDLRRDDVALHVQLRDSKNTTARRARSSRGCRFPSLKTAANKLEHGHLRQVRRRDDRRADAERERRPGTRTSRASGTSTRARSRRRLTRRRRPPARPPTGLRRLPSSRRRRSARASARAARPARATSTTDRRPSTGRRRTRSRIRAGSTRPI